MLMVMLLSVTIGVGGLGWTNSMRVMRIGAHYLIFQKRADNLSSEVLESILRISLRGTMVAPLMREYISLGDGGWLGLGELLLK